VQLLSIQRLDQPTGFFQVVRRVVKGNIRQRFRLREVKDVVRIAVERVRMNRFLSGVVQGLVPVWSGNRDYAAAMWFTAGIPAKRFVKPPDGRSPRAVAVLGIGAYRDAFEQPKASLGKQAERMHDAVVWVLPNPSGLNAHHQLDGLIALFRELRVAVYGSQRS
jgi:hypothetical protein